MLKVYTLGEFNIRLNGESIIDKIGTQNRLLLLFKYLLTNEGKRLLPDIIVEDLMEDKELKEPQNVLRTQLSRLRRLFNENSFYTINFLNGYYIFKLKENCIVDFLEFERQISNGNRTFSDSPSDSIDILKNALQLYKGTFLPEVEYDEWIMPIRNRLDRIYLKGLSNYLLALKIGELHHEIIEVCEKAIEIKPYEEFINKYFMESLLEVGQKRYALSHYKYYTSKLYNDLRAVPSPEIKEVYQTIQNHDVNFKDIIDLTVLDKKLELNTYSNGALICELHYFKFLYNWEQKNKDRNNRGNLFLGIITLDNIGYTPLSSEDIKKGMRTLMVIVYKNLRKTDVLSKWNDSQLVTLLYDISENDLHLINNRLQKNFMEEINNKNIVLSIKLKAL